MAKTFNIYLPNDIAEWFESQKNKSKMIQSILRDISKNEHNETFLVNVIKKLEEQKLILEDQLNFYYNRLSVVIEKKNEINEKQKDKLLKLLQERETQMDETHEKIQKSTIHDELMKRKTHNYDSLNKLVVKLRSSGNREFGISELKEYVKFKGLKYETMDNTTILKKSLI